MQGVGAEQSSQGSQLSARAIYSVIKQSVDTLLQQSHLTTQPDDFILYKLKILGGFLGTQVKYRVIDFRDRG